MALEDLAMMRAVHGSTVLYPCDANQTAQLVAAMADQPASSTCARRARSTPVLYAPDEAFPIGGSKVLRRRTHDQVTRRRGRHHACTRRSKAADAARGRGHRRPRDRRLLGQADRRRDAAHGRREATGGMVVVEDHWPEGGLGDAVLEAFAGGDAPLPRVRSSAFQMPGSGTPAELLDAAGISARHIVGPSRRLHPDRSPETWPDRTAVAREASLKPA